MRKICTVAATLVAMFFVSQPASAGTAEACYKITKLTKDELCVQQPQRVYRPAPRVERRPVYRSSVVTATACLTPEEWANCPTKRWWASSAGFKSGAPGAWRSPYFYARCGTVSARRGAPALWYNTSTGRQVWFRFG